MKQHLALSRQEALTAGDVGYGSHDLLKPSDESSGRWQECREAGALTPLRKSAGQRFRFIVILSALVAMNSARGADTNFYFQTVPRDMEPSIPGIQWYRDSGFSNQFDVLVSAGADMSSSIEIKAISFRMPDWDGDSGLDYSLVSAYPPDSADSNDLFFGKILFQNVLYTNSVPVVSLNNRSIDLLQDTPLDASALAATQKLYGTWWETVGVGVSLGGSTNVAKLNMASVQVILADASRYPNSAIKRLPTPSYELIWIPEPASGVLLGAGLALAVIMRRRNARGRS